METRTVPSFLPPVRYPSGRNPLDLAVADFDNNGIADLAAVNSNAGAAGTVSVFLGNGDGTFQEQITSGTRGAVSLLAADFDGDGLADLATTNVGCCGPVSVLLGNGDGSFQPPRMHQSNRFEDWGVGDLNGDGLADLMLASGSTLRVLLSVGDGAFVEGENYGVGSFTYTMSAADFNLDGFLDVVTARIDTGYDSFLNVLLGRGDGSFEEPVSYPIGFRSRASAVGDFNADFIPDLVLANLSGGMLGVLLGRGDGTFEELQQTPSGGGFNAVAVSDFNQDSFGDLVTAVSGSVRVFLGNGDGTFAPPERYVTGAYSLAVVTEDFDGDGYPDLAVPGLTTHTVSVLRNDATWGPAPSDGAPGSRDLIAGLLPPNSARPPSSPLLADPDPHPPALHPRAVEAALPARHSDLVKSGFAMPRAPVGAGQDFLESIANSFPF